MAAFIIWCLVACFFLGIGISCLFSKKATGFWANAKVPEIMDVKRYNYAMFKLWCAFAVVMILLGLPLLDGQNSPLIIVTILGLFLEVIVVMIVYVLFIEKKYRKND